MIFEVLLLTFHNFHKTLRFVGRHLKQVIVEEKQFKNVCQITLFLKQCSFLKLGNGLLNALTIVFFFNKIRI